MAVCYTCDGEGVVCDECKTGGVPIRRTEYGELCKECLESELEQEIDE